MRFYNRLVPISETTSILENRILCSPVVTGHGLFHWIMGLWFFTLYCVKIKITRTFLPDPKPKGETRVRIWRHEFSSKPSRLLKTQGHTQDTSGFLTNAQAMMGETTVSIIVHFVPFLWRTLDLTQSKPYILFVCANSPSQSSLC